MGPRLDPDATRVMEAAGTLARARRHATIEPLHLLGALVSHPRMEPLLTARGVNPSELAVQVEARIAESTPSGLYRDAGVVPVASPALEAVLASTHAHPLLAILRPVTIEQLANAACDDSSVALMLLEARAEITVAAHAVGQARTFAKSRGHAWVSVYHLAYVLMQQPWMAAALLAANIDREKLVEAIEEELVSARLPWAISGGLDKLPSRSALLAVTLRTAPIAALFTAVGGDVADVIRALVRSSGGSIDDESLPPDDDSEIAIVFHNDDFTTMDFVVNALKECFAISEAEATALMLDVHRSGSIVVKTCPPREARWRIAKARRLASLSKMPLRITWRQNSAPQPDG